MLKFNTLLRIEGLDPKDVKLVRHQDTRYNGRPTPYQLWRADDGRIELYQRIQKRAVFDRARIVASFVATPMNETLFIGLYAISAIGKATPGLIDPVSGDDVSGLHFYDLAPTAFLAEYRGRLLVDWGSGYRAWVQLASKQDKPIIEIRRTVGDPPFPGFLNFCEMLSGLVAVPLSWRTALCAVCGVYLLVDCKTGQQYVGSASGTTGFWGRWEQYVVSGHGGNRRMQDVPAADYQVTVLEVASSSVAADELAAMENRWKLKLLSRKFGLNAN